MILPERQWWSTSWPAPPWSSHWGKGLPDGSKNIHSKSQWPACWSFFVSACQKSTQHAAVRWRQMCFSSAQRGKRTVTHTGRLWLRGVRRRDHLASRKLERRIMTASHVLCFNCVWMALNLRWMISTIRSISLGEMGRVRDCSLSRFITWPVNSLQACRW